MTNNEEEPFIIIWVPDPEEDLDLYGLLVSEARPEGIDALRRIA